MVFTFHISVYCVLLALNIIISCWFLREIRFEYCVLMCSIELQHIFSVWIITYFTMYVIWKSCKLRASAVFTFSLGNPPNHPHKLNARVHRAYNWILARESRVMNKSLILLVDSFLFSFFPIHFILFFGRAPLSESVAEETLLRFPCISIFSLCSDVVRVRLSPFFLFRDPLVYIYLFLRCRSLEIPFPSFSQ